MSPPPVSKIVRVKLDLELTCYPGNGFTYITAIRRGYNKFSSESCNRDTLLLGECQGDIATIVRKLHRLSIKPAPVTWWRRVTIDPKWSCKAYPCKGLCSWERVNQLNIGVTRASRFCRRHAKTRGAHS